MSVLAWSAYAVGTPMSNGDSYLGQVSAYLGIVNWRSWLPLGIAGIIVWSLWIYRWLLSRRYRPTINGFRARSCASVVAAPRPRSWCRRSARIRTS